MLTPQVTTCKKLSKVDKNYFKQCSSYTLFTLVNDIAQHFAPILRQHSTKNNAILMPLLERPWFFVMLQMYVCMYEMYICRNAIIYTEALYNRRVLQQNLLYLECNKFLVCVKPRTDEQVFLDKFYLLVCTQKN